MDCGVQVEVSKVLLLVGVVVGVVMVVVVVRQLQALEMRWWGDVSWAFGGFMQAWEYGGGEVLQKSRRLRYRLVLSWYCCGWSADISGLVSSGESR